MVGGVYYNNKKAPLPSLATGSCIIFWPRVFFFVLLVLVSFVFVYCQLIWGAPRERTFCGGDEVQISHSSSAINNEGTGAAGLINFI